MPLLHSLRSHTHSWRVYLGTHCARVHFHTKLLRSVQQDQFSISLSRRVKDKFVKRNKTKQKILLAFSSVLLFFKPANYDVYQSIKSPHQYLYY